MWKRSGEALTRAETERWWGTAGNSGFSLHCSSSVCQRSSRSHREHCSALHTDTSNARQYALCPYSFSLSRTPQCVCVGERLQQHILSIECIMNSRGGSYITACHKGKPLPSFPPLSHSWVNLLTSAANQFQPEHWQNKASDCVQPRGCSFRGSYLGCKY